MRCPFLKTTWFGDRTATLILRPCSNIFHGKELQRKWKWVKLTIFITRMHSYLVFMGIGKLFLTSWTIIFLCISPWTYTQEGLTRVQNWSFCKVGLYTRGLIHREIRYFTSLDNVVRLKNKFSLRNREFPRK